MCMNMCIKMCTEVLVHLVDCVQQQQPYICYLVPTYVHRSYKRAVSYKRVVCLYLCIFGCACVCMFASLQILS